MAVYVELDELRAVLGLDVADTTDDDRLTACCQAATDAIDYACGTGDDQFSPVPELVHQAAIRAALNVYRAQPGMTGAQDPTVPAVPPAADPLAGCLPLLAGWMWPGF